MTWEQQMQEVKDFYKNNTIILADHMRDKETYVKYVESVYDHIKLGFEVKEYRELPVYFRFREDDEIHTMELRHYLTNLMMFHPFVELDVIDDLNESFIFNTKTISANNLKLYIDNKIIIPYRSRVSNTKMNKILAFMLYELTRISTDFNIIMGMTMNIEGFINLANESERFNEIIRTQLDDNLQPNEVETIIDERLEEELNLLANTDTLFSPMIKSGTGIKSKQLGELTISGGLKPDLEGQTIPLPINSNLLVGGLNSVASYYIDSLGGRKALILNKTEMGRSGHFARRMMLLGSMTHLDTSDRACNSINPLIIKIENKAFLSLYHGRYYKLPHWKNYRILDKNKDTDLIGKEIFIKSPLTCASKNGVCRECYGEELYWINKDVHIGLLAGATTTNPISQSILSSKHILTTQSEQIRFNENFYKFFTLKSNEVYINDDVEAVRDYEIVFISENVSQIDALNDSDITYYVTLFHVRNIKTGEIFDIEAEGAKEIFIDPDFYKMIGLNGKQSATHNIKFLDVEDEQRIGVVEIFNNELTKPLYDMMHLLNSEKQRVAMGITNIDGLVQKMSQLILEANIKTRSVHPEVLMAELVRDKNDILERPNFASFKGLRDATVLTLDSALENNKSALIGFSFQCLMRQLTDPLTFVKYGDSILDSLFKERR